MIKLISSCLYLADDDRRSKLIILSSITICWSPTKIQWPSIFYREDKGIEIHVKTKYHNTVTVSFETKMDQWLVLRWTLKEYKKIESTKTKYMYLNWGVSLGWHILQVNIPICRLIHFFISTSCYFAINLITRLQTEEWLACQCPNTWKILTRSESATVNLLNLITVNRKNVCLILPLLEMK